MLVKASAGLEVSIEGNPREYITDAPAVEVADTPYHRRLIADGSLVEAVPPKTQKTGGNGK